MDLSEDLYHFNVLSFSGDSCDGLRLPHQSAPNLQVTTHCLKK